MTGDIARVASLVLIPGSTSSSSQVPKNDGPRLVRNVNQWRERQPPREGDYKIPHTRDSGKLPSGNTVGT